MSHLVTAQARAYVNWGRWIAECPVGCGGALMLQPRQTTYHCNECHTLSNIEWPDNPDEIWEALSERSADKFKNWFPSGHDLALRANVPHGQTVTELREETAENQGG